MFHSISHSVITKIRHSLNFQLRLNDPNKQEGKKSVGRNCLPKRVVSLIIGYILSNKTTLRINHNLNKIRSSQASNVKILDFELSLLKI